MKKRILIIASLSFAIFCNAQKKIDAKNNELIVSKKALNFIAMGDFGRNGEYGQKEVATQMGKTAKEFGAEFFLITGDNFYPSGVASTQDYTWLASYEQIYTAHSLQNPWYVVLGNHDYKGNIQAEIDYGKISRRWNLPAKYYSKIANINDDSTQQVLFIFLNTTPFVTQYYNNDAFKENLASQDTIAQKLWVENTLKNASKNVKWKIVVGHHPLYTGGKRMESIDTKNMNDAFKPIFEKYNVDAYICGHEHNLQYIKPTDGVTHYFVTGSGSEASKPIILHPNGGKFALNENGFMAFSITATEIVVQIINKDGNNLYKTSVKK